MLVRESGDRLLKECVRGIIPLDIFVFLALFQGTSIEMDISLVKERGQIFFLFILGVCCFESSSLPGNLFQNAHIDTSRENGS